MNDLPNDCECCRKSDSPIVGVASVPGIAIGIRWCQRCIDAQVIPYWACINTLWTCGTMDNIHEGGQEEIKRSLLYHNKTMEDLENDVKETDKSYAEYCNQAVEDYNEYLATPNLSDADDLSTF